MTLQVFLVMSFDNEFESLVEDRASTNMNVRQDVPPEIIFLAYRQERRHQMSDQRIVRQAIGIYRPASWDVTCSPPGYSQVGYMVRFDWFGIALRRLQRLKVFKKEMAAKLGKSKDALQSPEELVLGIVQLHGEEGKVEGLTYISYSCLSIAFVTYYISDKRTRICHLIVVEIHS